MSNTETVVAKIHADWRLERGAWEMSLTEMQEFVGGFIETVASTKPGHYLICNEEGVLHDLPVNDLATCLVRPGTAMVGGLRGNVLLVKS